MRDAPVINPNYLTHPIDIEMAITAFERVRKIWESLPGLVIGEEYFPARRDVSTDKEILQHIRESSIQLWHAAPTCKMGGPKDPMAVLDTQARVRGVSGLRVVDANSFPILPPGHPMATVYMVALKIADDILKGAKAEGTYRTIWEATLDAVSYEGIQKVGRLVFGHGRA